MTRCPRGLPPRWLAAITYRTEAGPLTTEHEIEELDELHNLIERGPHWDCIIEIKITLARPSEDGSLTIERAAKL